MTAKDLLIQASQTLYTAIDAYAKEGKKTRVDRLQAIYKLLNKEVERKN